MGHFSDHFELVRHCVQDPNRMFWACGSAPVYSDVSVCGIELISTGCLFAFESERSPPSSGQRCWGQQIVFFVGLPSLSRAWPTWLAMLGGSARSGEDFLRYKISTNAIESADDGDKVPIMDNRLAESLSQAVRMLGTSRPGKNRTFLWAQGQSHAY